MKKLSKEQIEKRKRIKQYLLRSLHIVCYVLSALFVVVCIVVGVQSCNSKKTSNVNRSRSHPQSLVSSYSNIFDFKYVYTFENDTGTMPLSNQQEFAVLKNVDIYNNVSGPAGASLFGSISFSDVYIYSRTNESFVDVYQCNYTLVKYEESSTSSYVRWRVYALSLYLSTGETLYFAVKSTKYWDINYTFNLDVLGYDLYFYTTNSQKDNAFFHLFTEAKPLNFVFNNQINYNGYFNASLSSPYIPHSNLSVNIDLPLFMSAGSLYNRIHLQFTDAQGSSFLDNKGNVFTLTATAGTYMTYLYLEYVNTYTNVTTLVNTRDFSVLSNNSNVTRFNLNSSSWISTNYRSITFVSSIDDTELNMLSKFNSNTGNIYNGTPYTDIGLGNVFSLLSTAFSGLVGLFTIQLIPGITIGILVFMPLIVGIIIVIVKLVKK